MTHTEKEELGELLNIITQDSSNIGVLSAADKLRSQFKAYIEIVEPVEECRAGSPDRLWNIVTRLKQQGGEEWAVGEMLERTLNLLDALDLVGDK